MSPSCYSFSFATGEQKFSYNLAKKLIAILGKYGGSTENRVRLLVEVCQAVREKLGKDFPIGIRISQAKVNDYTHKWADGEKDAEIIFKQLSTSGIDFFARH